MIESIIIKYLRDKLGIKVYAEIPESPPKEFIIVEKTSSGMEDYIYHATVALQSYSDTLLNAAVLNDKVKKAMDVMIELPEISSSKLNSDYNFTDTATKRYRYQAVYNIVFFD